MPEDAGSNQLNARLDFVNFFVFFNQHPDPYNGVKLEQKLSLIPPDPDANSTFLP